MSAEGQPVDGAPAKAASHGAESAPRGPITVRAVLLGLVLIPINIYWVTEAELRWYMIVTLNPLFLTPVFFLVLLVALNAVVSRVRPRWAFSAAELLTVYIMLAISCTVATLDYSVSLTRVIAWGAWYATPENKWDEVVVPHIPSWTLMWDRSVLRGFFEGGVSPYTPGIFVPWLTPLLVWIGFMLVSFGTMLCLNSMVRKAWIEDTKLSFPIVRLPLAMVGLETAGFFRSREMVAGVALPVISGTLNGLAELYPGIPHFQTRARRFYFSTLPWQKIGSLRFSLYPFVIGLAYFVPLDVLFSCWFFYLFVKAQRVVGYYVGAANLPGFPFVMEQGIGAWATYGALILYVTRDHWRRLFRAMWRRQPLGDEGEMLPYRQALFGALAGMVALVVFWRIVGMTLLPAIIAVGSYFLLALCITRIRAEAGSQHSVVDMEPMNTFGLVDTRWLSKGDIVGAGLSHWFWRFNRSHAMPTQLEGLKMWNAAGHEPRGLAVPMLAATVAACVGAMWACVHVAYRDGAAAKCVGFKPLTGPQMYVWMHQMLGQGRALEWPRLIAVLAASGLILLLRALQGRYTSLWFHPLGYCAGPALMWNWFPFLVAWLIKGAIIRYGGQNMYRRLIPFFLGLVLGDYFTGGVWAIISPIIGRHGYEVFH